MIDVLHAWRGNRGKPRTESEGPYSLSAIAAAIEEAYGIKIVKIRSKGKGRVISTGRKVFSQVARAYGYKGKEIAAYTRKDPAILL